MTTKTVSNGRDTGASLVGKDPSSLTTIEAVKLAFSLSDTGFTVYPAKLMGRLRGGQTRGLRKWFWVTNAVLAAILVSIALVGSLLLENRSGFELWVMAAVFSVVLSYITYCLVHNAPDDIAYLKLTLILLPATVVQAIIVASLCTAIGPGGHYFYYMSISASAGILVLGSLAVMYVPQMSILFTLIVFGVFSWCQIGHGIEGMLWIFFAFILVAALDFMLLAWFRSLCIQVAVRETSRSRQKIIKDLLIDFECDATDWIWEVDERLRLIRVSTRMEELLGQCDDQLRGVALVNLFDPAHPGTAELRRRFADQSGFRRIELRVRSEVCNSCALAWELSGRPILDQDEQLVGYHGVGSDVTEHLALDRLRLAEERFRATSELIGGVAHDFNNILQQVVANVSTVASSNTASESDKAAATRAGNAAIQAGNMTTQLLAYSRQEVLSPEDIALVPTLEQIIELQLAVTPVGRITVNIPDPLYVRADPELFRRALGNLVKNACEAAGPEGAVETTAVLEIISEGVEVVVLNIKDTGAGFDEESLAKATEPFYSTKRAQGGVGLGLSLVSGFARQSSGELKLANSRDGALVTLSLPAARRDAVSSDTSDKDPGGEISGSILLCEDEELVAAALSELLETAGMKVTTTSDLRSSFAQISARDFDFALIDLILPDGSGVELVRRLEPTSTKIVVMTGYQGYEEPSNVFDQIVLRKPFAFSDLVSHLRA